MSPVVAVCPTTALVWAPEGSDDPAGELREVVVETLHDLAAGAERLVVWSPVELSPESARALVGHLLALAALDLPFDVVTVSEPGVRAAPGDHLLVLADGTARRAAGPEGPLDERCFPFDDLVADALEDGDGDILAHLDERLGEQLSMTGRHTLAALGRAMPRAEAELRYRDDPLGTSWFVALWR